MTAIRTAGDPCRAGEFWSRIDRRAPDECWPWLAGLQHGYGFLKYEGKRIRAHRLALILAGEPVPAGLSVMHSCDNKRCCNPSHLSVGTQAQNMADAAERGRMPRGEAVRTARLTPDDVAEIRRRYAAGGCTQRELGREFGVGHDAIGDIVKRAAWRHIA